ncbi:hypothetical protein Xbed_03489 [Xenorhabdus beddingii]|uniref:Uncharacterized protein n=1 Tax=Xenorhabdus beddingii TaxID=40578 RepID=A0A1Y2SEE5_9GAMM|nr:hypothetical protein Xbed_03489 [Xenorhabdus beddingii]
MQTPAIEQGRPNFPRRGVKSDIGTMGNAIIRANIGKTAIDDKTQHIAVFDHHAFRLTGRT